MAKIAAYVGRAYTTTGRLLEAIALLKDTVEKRKAKLGPDHSHTLGVRDNLAVLFQDARKIDEADYLLLELL